VLEGDAPDKDHAGVSGQECAAELKVRRLRRAEKEPGEEGTDERCACTGL